MSRRVIRCCVGVCLFEQLSVSVVLVRAVIG